MIQVAIDSDQFFFSIANSSKASKKGSPAGVKNLLQHISTHTDKFELCVSSTVLAESVMVCLESKKHDIDELHEMIIFEESMKMRAAEEFEEIELGGTDRAQQPLGGTPLARSASAQADLVLGALK